MKVGCIAILHWPQNYTLSSYTFVSILLTHTCIRVNDEQFRSNSLELIRDLGIWADVSICGRDLQDEPACRRVLWDVLSVQGLEWGQNERKMEEGKTLKWLPGGKGHDKLKVLKLHQSREEKNWLYLFAYGAVVIGIEHFDLHSGFGREDAITGSNVQKIIVLLFTVQRFSDRDLPFILNVLDGKLAKWVPSCLVWQRNKPLQKDQKLRSKKAGGSH